MTIHTLYTHSSTTNEGSIDCICIGSGRFLRAVLVPSLVGCGMRPVVFQTRGRTFLEYCLARTTNTITGDGDDDGDGDGTTRYVDGITYEVDTVLPSTTTTSSSSSPLVHTDVIPIEGAGTLGTAEGKQSLFDLLLPPNPDSTNNTSTTNGTVPSIHNLRMIGIGVTEAGLSSPNSQPIRDLAAVLDLVRRNHLLICDNPHERICVINTDNVPGNGRLLERYITAIASEHPTDAESFVHFVRNNVRFLDTMVDRITSHRTIGEGEVMGGGSDVPRAEPVPAKALVVEDLGGDLPRCFTELTTTTGMKRFGVVVRTQPCDLAMDVALKLRVANGTHTAVAQVMALSGLVDTTSLSPNNNDGFHTSSGSCAHSYSVLLVRYLDSFFQRQILPAVSSTASTTNKTESDMRDEAEAVWSDWRGRMLHPSFGLGMFFIGQNAAEKGGIRLGPTICDLVMGGMTVTCSTAFALASILRYLTPTTSSNGAPEDGIYRGWLDGFPRSTVASSSSTSSEDGEEIDGRVEYATGLSYCLKRGWYEFRCGCEVLVPSPSVTDNDKDNCGDGDGKDSYGGAKKPLPTHLATATDPSSVRRIVRAYLLAEDGGDLSRLLDPPSSSATAAGAADMLETLIEAVAILYARSVEGEGVPLIQILKEMDDGEGVYHPEGLRIDHRELIQKE